MMLRPGFLEDDGLVKIPGMLIEFLRNIAIVARGLGSSFRAQLEERAGYRKDGR